MADQDRKPLLEDEFEDDISDGVSVSLGDDQGAEDILEDIPDPQLPATRSRRSGRTNDADTNVVEDSLDNTPDKSKKTKPENQKDPKAQVESPDSRTTNSTPSGAETPANAKTTKSSDPGKTREPDPLKRGSVGDLNKPPEERKPSELRRRFQEGRERLGKGVDDLRQARDLAGQKIGQVSDALSDPVQAAKDAAARQGKKLAKEGAKRAGQAAKTGAKAAGRAAAQGARVLGQLALQAIGSAVTAIVGFLGPWGAAILALVVAVGVGVAFLWPKGGASTPPQLADMSKPAIVASIDRLAALAGDQAALARQVEDKTSGLEQDINRAREESASAPLTAEIARELDLATVHLNTVRAGGVNMSNDERTRLVNAIFYSLQRAVALYRGVNLESGNDIATKAAEATGQGSSWIYTNNEQGTGSLPLRDGSNVVGNKRGCNSSGFVVYAVRDAGKCAQCVTPTLDKFAALFSIFQSVDISGTEAGGNINKGDILAMKKPNSQYLEGFIVLNPQVQRPQDTELAYCGLNGPAKAKYSEVAGGTFGGRNGDGARTPAFRLRLRTASRVDAPAAQ